MLHDFISAHRSEIIARTRDKARVRSQSPVGSVDVDKGIPLFVFLAELSQALMRAPAGSLDLSAAKHGSDLLRMGFSVSQVVHGYGDVRQVVTELARESATPISADDLGAFSCCLDEATASAITEYGRQREERISRTSTERLGTLAHELRNSLSSALLAFRTIERCVVAPPSTSAVLSRSLLRLSDLIDRSLSEVRLESGLVQLQQVSILDLVQAVAISAAADASQRGISFRVGPVAARLVVKADRHLLIGAVENVLQNALKFTPQGGQVHLAIHDLEGHVRIEVADGCGGLPEGKSHTLFDAFTQQGSDRTGLGLGLWISRSSLATFGGTISVRDVPGKGCVFSMDVPKADEREASPSIEPARRALDSGSNGDSLRHEGP